MTPSQRPPLAIVGISALFPGSRDVSGFWRDIRSGRDCLTEVPPSHWLPGDHFDPDPAAQDKTYAKRGGFLPPVEFDAAHWGVPPAILRATDTSQLLGLILAEQVLRDAARERFDTMDRSRISVILGGGTALELVETMAGRLQKPIWVKALREHGVPEERVQRLCRAILDRYPPWGENSFPGMLGNVVAGRIANRLNLGGTNCVADAACASAMAALDMAARELYLGDSDLVITGGVDTLNGKFMFTCFSKTPALSPTGDCRPFSDAGDGTMLGEGLGMVALKRMEDAEREGDLIYAVLRGIGSASDGRAKSVYAPVPEGQAEAMVRAQALAGFDPRTVELLEAHGTGTKAGDTAEFQGLKLAYTAGDSEEGRPWCALGSVKSQIGHTKAAAGAAGLIKAVLALHHKVLPPTLKVDRPNPGLGMETSAFYLNTVARPWIRGSRHLRRAGVSSFGFGGTNFHVLLEEYAGPCPRPPLLRALPAELIVIGGRDGEEVASRARALAERRNEPGLLAWAAWQTQADYRGGEPARLALVAEDAAMLGARLEQAAARIRKDPGSPFTWPDGTAYGIGPRSGGTALLFPGQGGQRLGMGADLAQHFPAVREIWDRASDLVPGLDAVVFPPPRFDPGARDADERRLDEPRWAYAAIGCASAALLALSRALGIEASALGGLGFGEVTALHAAGGASEADLLRAARRHGEWLAAGSLSSTGGPGAEPFTAFLEHRASGPPRCAVYSGEPAAMVAAMSEAGIHTFLEVGPGSAFTGLVGQVLADRPHAAIALDPGDRDGVTALLRGLAGLAALGVPLNLSALWEGYAAPEDPAARPLPKLPVLICGANGRSGPSSPSAAALPESADQLITLDEHSHGYLADHTIAGAVVVPMALVVEWLLRAARTFAPDLVLRTLQELKVIRGIKLDAFRRGGHAFTVRCARRDGDAGPWLHLELLGAGSVLHYQAQAMPGVPALPPVPAPLGLAPWGEGRIYGDVLFHGPGFQVVEGIEGCGEQGIQGRVLGVRRANWPEEAWLSDPLALDGALQLATLWGREHLGGAVLPLSFESLCLSDLPLSGDPVRVAVRCRRRNASVMIADAVFLDAAGRMLADLRGAELVARPDWKPSQ